MRSLSKYFIVAVAVLATGLVSSSVRANNVLVGNFTLPHATQWNDTVLPAGDYTFKLSRTQSNADLLVVQGAKQTVSVFVYGESACETCREASLNLEVRNDHRFVNSLELAGFHVNFKVAKPAGAAGEELVKTPKATEQVAVHVASN